MTTRRVRVARKTLEAQDICSFELVAADGGALPPFTAGAHIDVRLEGGLVRQYSLCNDSRETQRYQIAVLREPASRGGSRAMHALEPGKELDISAPRNHFALAPGANRHLLLAGGIGITPILCMAEHLGERAPRSICTIAPARPTGRLSCSASTHRRSRNACSCTTTRGRPRRGSTSPAS